jgi:tRNA (guanine37-N1)-methyltransferase
MSGNHEEIRRWRHHRALEKTLRNRPDLLQGAVLSEEDSTFLAGLKRSADEGGRSGSTRNSTAVIRNLDSRF